MKCKKNLAYNPIYKLIYLCNKKYQYKNNDYNNNNKNKKIQK